MIDYFDAIVIGAGQAGPSFAVRCAEAGMKVALVEKTRLGGTCVNNGCIPTKTLVASARAAHVARRGADFGVVTGPVSVDFPAVMRRKDAVVEHSRVNLDHWISGTQGLTFVLGEARFLGPKLLAVGERRLGAPLIVINTGGRPILPPWPGLEGAPVLTNESVMDLKTLPERLIIAGGSYIGLEFAQMFRRFGSEVAVLEYADRLIAREDEAVSQAVRRRLEEEGISFHLSVRDVEVAHAEGRFHVKGSAGGEAFLAEGSDLLLAVGRRPNVEALDLPAAGVALDARGFIAVDDGLQTNVEGVFALGDVNGRGAFTHTSYNDYEILAANLLYGEARKVSERLTAYALFTDPPLARVGASRTEALASGRRVLSAEMPMTRVGRARERGETEGFMSVLVDAETEVFLGATLFCIEADEIIHSFIGMMNAKQSYKVMLRAVPVHPTVSELIPTLLAQLKPLADAGR